MDNGHHNLSGMLHRGNGSTVIAVHVSTFLQVGIFMSNLNALVNFPLAMVWLHKLVSCATISLFSSKTLVISMLRWSESNAFAIVVMCNGFSSRGCTLAP